MQARLAEATKARAIFIDVNHIKRQGILRYGVFCFGSIYADRSQIRCGQACPGRKRELGLRRQASLFDKLIVQLVGVALVIFPGEQVPAGQEQRGDQ